MSDPEDMETMVRAVKLARKVLNAPAFDPYRGVELRPELPCTTDDDIRAFVRRHAGTIYHPVGTCKMGHDPMAVVDDELRVHGLQGLRVVDASIMPLLVGGNTNAPTVMIAEKASDFIKRARAGQAAEPVRAIESRSAMTPAPVAEPVSVFMARQR
jgi:choline dehydrogenase-like flavoprotein